MKLPVISRFNFCLQVVLLLPVHLATCKPEQHILAPPPLPRLRNATTSDIPSITSIISAAFAPLPNWNYIYQFRKDYPEEHQRCGQEAIAKGFSHNDITIRVVEAPHDSDLTVAAVAIWRRQSSNTTQSARSFMSRSGKCTHADLNVTRALDWERKFNALIDTHITKYFGPENLYLDTLATHPEHQSRGAGTRLLAEGIEAGKREGVNVTLIAQPTAKSFYLGRGFEEVKNVSVETVDRDGEFGFNVMAYDFHETA
jgi:ribosomal protein S18 acetylase RimI-like enzyme